jgi:beta-lactam-binding protein with PASTA domain
MTTDVSVDQRWIDIPSVSGMTVREASDRLTEAGLAPVASPRRFTAEVDEIVGGTLPPEGAALLRTSRIDLLPARKEAVAKSADEELTADQLFDLGIMPNLGGLTGEQAIALVQAHGFIAWTRDTWTDRVDPGFVVSTNPGPGSGLVGFGVIGIFVAVPVPPPDPFVVPPPRMPLKS